MQIKSGTHFKSIDISTITPTRQSIVAIVWLIALLVSDLPDIVCQILYGLIPIWLFWAKLAVLLVVVIVSLLWKHLPFCLSQLCILLLILTAGRKALFALGITASYVQSNSHYGLVLRLAQFEGLRSLLAVIMVATLLIMGKRPKELFLVKGNLGKWKLPGTILGFIIMVLTLLFFNYELPPSATIIKALPLIPIALFFAVFAALDEEIRCRATLLTNLVELVGKNQSIFITAIYFGLGHYFGGVPSGIAGFLIAGGLGLLYAKMILDTQGIYMSWFNHFLTNVPTFAFWAIGSTH
jgi:membrane protease YdiL (CAAX protease family)